jgi:SnoaL-like domain
MPGGARMKMKDDVQQAVKAYFDGLAAKDVSSVPWANNAALRTPLNPAGGESALIRGRKAILNFFAGIFPALRGVKVVRHYTGGAGWVAAQAEIVLSNGKTLYVLDAFHVQGGEIVEQQNHYDSRPAAG